MFSTIYIVFIIYDYRLIYDNGTDNLNAYKYIKLKKKITVLKWLNHLI